jgi:hypothetical protein
MSDPSDAEVRLSSQFSQSRARRGQHDDDNSRHDIFYDETSPFARCGIAQVGENFVTLLIVLVVKDHFEAVFVSQWNLLVMVG